MNDTQLSIKIIEPRNYSSQATSRHFYVNFVYIFPIIIAMNLPMLIIDICEQSKCINHFTVTFACFFFLSVSQSTNSPRRKEGGARWRGNTQIHNIELWFLLSATNIELLRALRLPFSVRFIIGHFVHSTMITFEYFCFWYKRKQTPFKKTLETNRPMIYWWNVHANIIRMIGYMNSASNYYLLEIVVCSNSIHSLWSGE